MSLVGCHAQPGNWRADYKQSDGGGTCELCDPDGLFFSWQGEIDRDDEVLLILKSRADKFENHLIPAGEATHPFELLESIALPILNGSAQYKT